MTVISGISFCLTAIDYKTIAAGFPEKEPLAKQPAPGNVFAPADNLLKYKSLRCKLPPKFLP